MDTSRYFIMKPLEDGHICETLDGELVLAVSRHSEKDYFRHGSGYLLEEDALDTLGKGELDEVHIHVEDTGDFHRFDADRYEHGERVNISGGERVCLPIVNPDSR